MEGFAANPFDPEIGGAPSEIPAPDTPVEKCEECGNSDFDYDPYFKEFTCQNCGWQIS